MKKKKDCKECGTPLKDWQIKRDYDLCLDCYNEMKSKKFKTVRKLLHEKTIQEEGEEEIKDVKKRREVKEQMEEEATIEEHLGEKTGHLEEHLQGEEE